MPEMQAPLLVGEMRQQVTWQAGPADDEVRTAHLLVQSPMSTMLVVLDEAAALALADGMRDIFVAPTLTIARDLPGTNGQHT